MDSLRMMPMAGCSGDSPKPRKVTAASWSMAWGKSSTRPTRYCGSTKGSTWVRAMRAGPAPSLRATAT